MNLHILSGLRLSRWRVLVMTLIILLGLSAFLSIYHVTSTAHAQTLAPVTPAFATISQQPEPKPTRFMHTRSSRHHLTPVKLLKLPDLPVKLPDLKLPDLKLPELPVKLPDLKLPRL